MLKHKMIKSPSEPIPRRMECWENFDKFCAAGTGRDYIADWGVEAAGILAFCSARCAVLTKSVQVAKV